MKKIFFAALAATVLFASCSKDETGKANGGDGAETLMGLSLTFPSSSGTRAAVDDNATVDEMKVTDITIFLYGTGGAPALGNMSTLTLADFVENPANTWTLKHEKRITTTTGVKSVYVGVNLSGSKFMNDGTTTVDENSNESLLSGLYETSLIDLISMDPATKLPGTTFRMFSDVVARPMLVAETDPNWSTNNVVAVNVERQVAKMTADFADGKTATTLAQWEIAPSGSNNYYGTHTMEGYYLGQAGKDQMYRYSQYNLDGKRLSSTARTGLGFTQHFKQLNDYGTKLNAAPAVAPAANARTSFFGIENISLNNVRKETTVAVFWTKFVPTKATIYDEALVVGSNPKVGWIEENWDPGDLVLIAEKENGDPLTVEPGSFWVVKNGTDYKFFYSQEASLQYAADFNIDGYSQPPLKGGTLYQKGHSYFYQYLGYGAAPLTYEFARNQYYHLIVEGFNGLGTPGTLEEQPVGTDPDDPTNPVPPGEPTPDVPDPEEPTPGNEDETTLRVKVVVKAWDIKVMNNITLEE